MTETAPHHLLEPGRNCFRIETADKLSVIVDADDYFRIARAAMLKARRRITLIGWDFDARITLGRGGPDDRAPDKLGPFITWLVEHNPELEIFLLRWDVGGISTLFRGTTIFTLMKWMAHPRIHTKLDRVHPVASSHHQKIVVIDDCLAFCGGIDMTADRWDTREHKPEDERRRRPSGARYKPWHDATTAITGPMTKSIAEICRDRWKTAGGAPEMTPIEGVAACWPEGLEPHFQALPIAVSRSAPPVEGRPPVHEIEALYLDQIARAKRFIYAESQYFASRRIAEAIARRLDEPGGPEIVVVNPVTAQGWLEPMAMDTARARLAEALHRRDHDGRFRIYHPFNAGGEAIYVHAKVLVVDDRILRVGSSNMNNRSMRLDTECDVTVDADLGGGEAARRAITAIRDDLLAEHLATTPDAVADTLARTGSLIQTIEALRGEGRSLRPYEVPDLSAIEEWLADNEVLDPEGPDEMFESLSKRGLFRNWRRKRDARRQSREQRRA